MSLHSSRNSHSFFSVIVSAELNALGESTVGVDSSRSREGRSCVPGFHDEDAVEKDDVIADIAPNRGKDVAAPSSKGDVADRRLR